MQPTSTSDPSAHVGSGGISTAGPAAGHEHTWMAEVYDGYSGGNTTDWAYSLASTAGIIPVEPLRDVVAFAEPLTSIRANAGVDEETEISGPSCRYFSAFHPTAHNLSWDPLSAADPRQHSFILVHFSIPDSAPGEPCVSEGNILHTPLHYTHFL